MKFLRKLTFSLILLLVGYFSANAQQVTMTAGLRWERCHDQLQIWLQCLGEFIERSPFKLMT